MRGAALQQREFYAADLCAGLFFQNYRPRRRKAANCLWPNASVFASPAPYSAIRRPSASWIPSDTATMHCPFRCKLFHIFNKLVHLKYALGRYMRSGPFRNKKQWGGCLSQPHGGPHSSTQIMLESYTRASRYAPSSLSPHTSRRNEPGQWSFPRDRCRSSWERHDSHS